MVSRAFILFLLFIVVSQQAIADPIARIDRSVIAIDDTLTFTIRINETGSFNGLDLSPLDKDFHVLGNSQSSRHMIRNGQSESWTEWTITLMPKRKGRLTIPPITIDGQKTQRISINVQPSVPRSAGNPQPVFLESEVDTESVFVQQQIIFTLRVFQSIQLDNMNISEPEFDNAVIEKLAQNSFQRRIQNTPYRVHELRYAIFPQETGEFIIPELVFSATESVARRSMFNLPGRGKTVRKMSQQHIIRVKQPPASFTGSTWLPAQSIKLMETWSSTLDNIRVGESITRTITIRAEGLLDSQIPPLEFPSIVGAKFYPDQGEAKTDSTTNGVISTRTDSMAIIPTREGEVALPEIRLSWWDTQRNTIQEAVIPASTLTVKPALEGAQSNSTPLAINHSQTPTTVVSTPLTTATNNIPWQIISALLAAAWMITLLLWWRLKQSSSALNQDLIPRSHAGMSEKQAFKMLTEVCRNNDIQQTRQAIIEWGRHYWPDHNINSLQDIQQHCNHPPLSNAMLQLDNYLYGNSHDSSSWNGESLLSVIKLMRERDKKNSSQQAQGLPPLYNH
ncbi:MAG: BatD family protein [Pseudomonadales bacterium]